MIMQSPPKVLTCSATTCCIWWSRVPDVCIAHPILLQFLTFYMISNMKKPKKCGLWCLHFSLEFKVQRV